MKFPFFLLLFFVVFATDLRAQEVSLIKFPELDQMVKEPGKLRLINFWATWCKPCIEELPYFESANQSYGEEGLEVILVSFDFGDDAQKKVEYFIKKKGITSKVVILDETDFNAFIDKIDPRWSGALPATLIVENDENGEKKRDFFEKQFEETELTELIETYIN